MAIVVTQRFTGRGLVKVSGNWVARESWVVTGTNDEATAIEAAVSFDSPHPDNNFMRAGVRNAEAFNGPLSWIVHAEYSFGDHGLCAPNPLNELPVLSWDFGTETVASDTDENDNAIVNSAGYPIDPPETITLQVVGLCVRRAEPFFNVQKALIYTDHCNSDAFNVLGAGGVGPGQAYCNYIKPAAPYTNAAPFVWVEYRFTFKPLDNPFDIHIIDAGQMGWYDDGGVKRPGPFVDASGNAVTFDVRLNGAGIPIDSSFKVLKKDGVSTATAVAPATTPPGLTIEGSYSTSYQKTLLWQGKLRVPFSGLL